jgi:hypothetical protein
MAADQQQKAAASDKSRESASGAVQSPPSHGRGPPQPSGTPLAPNAYARPPLARQQAWRGPGVFLSASTERFYDALEGGRIPLPFGPCLTADLHAAYSHWLAPERPDPVSAFVWTLRRSRNVERVTTRLEEYAPRHGSGAFCSWASHQVKAATSSGAAGAGSRAAAKPSGSPGEGGEGCHHQRASPRQAQNQIRLNALPRVASVARARARDAYAYAARMCPHLRARTSRVRALNPSPLSPSSARGEERKEISGGEGADAGDGNPRHPRQLQKPGGTC